MSGALFVRISGAVLMRGDNIIDDYNREILAMEGDTSLPALRLTRVLDQLLETRGRPTANWVDNGPEFLFNHLNDWWMDNKVNSSLSKPENQCKIAMWSV